MKAKGAPGKDKIDPRFLKALGEASLIFLLDIINDSWNSGNCPASWRIAVIIPLLKKGKPASEMNSYRPVALTSCVGKTMERMVANRLSHLAETNGWWSNDQAGFRKMRSCEDQVLRLSQSISNGFQSSPPKRSLLALLDYSKTYDMVWKDKLYQTMIDKGVPLAIVKWCRSFLADRRAMVRLDGITGKSMKMHQGVPQGSVLSPLFFLFYIDGVREVIPEGVNISLYADDIAIWAQDADKTKAQDMVQEAIIKIANWSTSFKLALNPGKCEVNLFSTSPKDAQWTPVIKMGQYVLKHNKTPTFLGVTYDRSLSFRPHAMQVKTRILNRIRIMASLATKEWGWNRRSLQRIYQAIIHSVLNYCGAGWQPWLAKSNVLLLERTHNRALRVLTGQLSDTPLECLRLEAGFSSFETSIRRNAAIAWEKSARLPDSNPRHELFGSPVFHRWKRKDCSSVAKETCSSLGLNENGRKPITCKVTPPWFWDRRSKLIVNTSLIGNSNKMDNKQIQLSDAIKTIEANGKPAFIIYTDGSAEGGLRNGGSAAVITSGSPSNPNLIATIKAKGSKLTYSYETEVTALLLAAKWIEGQGARPEGHILICSDSQSALSCLSGSGLGDDADMAKVRRILTATDRQVTLQWVPGHCDLVGNDWADSAAGEVAAAPLQHPDDIIDTPPSSSISFEAVRALILREIIDPPTTHQRTKTIYADDEENQQNQKKNIQNGPRISRKEAVLLAQLRSGHCHTLAAYRNVVDKKSSPYCPHCKDEYETIEHWLRECPATAVKRMRLFGGPAPPMTALVNNTEAVLAFARGLQRSS